MGTYLCLVATAELSRLPSHPPGSRSPVLASREMPQSAVCVHFRPGELRKDRDLWSYGAQSLQVTELLEISQTPTLPTHFPRQPASSSEVHPSPGRLTIPATSFPKPPRPELVRSGSEVAVALPSLWGQRALSSPLPQLRSSLRESSRGSLNKSLSNPSWPDTVQVLANPCSCSLIGRRALGTVTSCPRLECGLSSKCRAAM